MNAKKYIKLINSERTDFRLVSGKACVGTSTDICKENVDIAECSVNSYDVCGKDLYGCSDGETDYCYYIDNEP